MKKILLIGNPNSYIFQRFAFWIKDDDIKVNILQNTCATDEAKKVFKANEIELINDYTFFKKIPKIRTAVLYSKGINSIKDFYYDTIMIHSIGSSKLMKYLWKKIRKKCKKLILIYWGSDILKTSKIACKENFNLVNFSDTINLTTEEMRKCFREYYGNSFDEKFTTLKFGTEFPEVYNETMKENNFKNFREKHNLSSDAVLISIGYNGGLAQQHIRAIEGIIPFINNSKKEVVLVLQMTYALESETYLREIIDKLNKYNIKHIILRDFMNMKESAIFKESVDIFINSQISDALSASVLEYLYSGTLVISPKWINYAEWKNDGIFFVNYNDFDQLSEVLEKNQYSKLTDKLIENRNIIKDNYTWRKAIKEWQKII